MVWPPFDLRRLLGRESPVYFWRELDHIHHISVRKTTPVRHQLVVFKIPVFTIRVLCWTRWFSSSIEPQATNRISFFRYITVYCKGKAGISGELDTLTSVLIHTRGYCCIFERNVLVQVPYQGGGWCWHQILYCLPYLNILGQQLVFNMKVNFVLHRKA